LIGEQRAERVKKAIGSAIPLDTEITTEVSGRDTISGMPRKIVITSEEVRHALHTPIAEIIEAVMKTGMDKVLANATGLDVVRVEDPLNSVAKGTDSYVKNLELWKDLATNVN
jgi:rod shape-determining protein MreB